MRLRAAAAPTGRKPAPVADWKVRERQALRWLHGQIRDQVFAWCTIGTTVSARLVADRVLCVLLEAGAVDVPAIERMQRDSQSALTAKQRRKNRVRWGLSPTGNAFWICS
jgi:hypothetical protein